MIGCQLVLRSGLHGDATPNDEHVADECAEYHPVTLGEIRQFCRLVDAQKSECDQT
jgi:hypothetical protein